MGVNELLWISLSSLSTSHLLALIILVGNVQFQEEGEVHAREDDVVTGPVKPHLRSAAERRQTL